MCFGLQYLNKPEEVARILERLLRVIQTPQLSTKRFVSEIKLNNNCYLLERVPWRMLCWPTKSLSTCRKPRTRDLS
jgi:hypothetical protein